MTKMCWRDDSIYSIYQDISCLTFGKLDLHVEMYLLYSLGLYALLWDVSGCVNTVSVSLKGKRRRFIFDTYNN